MESKNSLVHQLCKESILRNMSSFISNKNIIEHSSNLTGHARMDMD